MKIDIAGGMPYKIRFSSPAFTRSPAQPIHVRPEVSATLANDEACYWVFLCNWWRKRSKEKFPRENVHVFRCMCPVLDCQVLEEHGSPEASPVEATSWSGDGALDIWGDAETAESSQTTEKWLRGDLIDVCNHLIRRQREDGVKPIKKFTAIGWKATDTIWNMGNSD